MADMLKPPAEVGCVEWLATSVLVALAKVARRMFRWLARRGMTAELALLAAGVDVDRLAREVGRAR